MVKIFLLVRAQHMQKVKSLLTLLAEIIPRYFSVLEYFIHLHCFTDKSKLIT